jgi:uncharacterized delta-60 repeat protein
MGKYTTFLIFLLCLKVYSQNYALDPMFGESGAKVYDGYSSGANPNPENGPSEIYFVDNKYIFAQSYQIARFNIDGSRDVTFGLNGKLTIAQTGNYFTVLSSRIHNGSIYICGQVYIGGSYNTDAFVAKLSLDGVLDASFGTGGISILEIGNADNSPSGDGDKFKDLLIHPDGTITVTGHSNNGVLVGRLTTAGISDTAFGTAGYKYYGAGTGEKILEYQGNILLLAANTLKMIDANGNYVISFGTNGSTALTYGDNVNRTRLFDNKICLVFSFYVGSPGFGGYSEYRVKVFDLATLALSFPSIAANNAADVTFANNKFLVVDGSVPCTDGGFSCFSQRFRARRFNLDGTLDVSFNATGQFVDNSAESNLAHAMATSIYLHDDGRILVAGQRHGYTGGMIGMKMIRVIDAALGVGETGRNSGFGVYPNPAKQELFVLNDNNFPIDNVIFIDMTGKVIECPRSNQIINLDKLQSGLYSVKIKSNGETYIFKFIKE